MKEERVKARQIKEGTPTSTRLRTLQDQVTAAGAEHRPGKARDMKTNGRRRGEAEADREKDTTKQRKRGVEGEV